MGCGKWPPIYDEAYTPKPDQRYWFPDRETMKPEEREKIILRKLRAQMRYAYDNAPFYHRRWEDAGIHPDDIATLRDFRRVPFVYKQDIREDQAKNPPFGSYLCIPNEKIFTIHGTSGTTGKPTAFALSEGDVKRIANAHARVMWGFGLRPSDKVMITSVFSLYLGSWGALWGVRRLGAAAFPFGAGAPGMTRMAVRWAAEVKPTALYGTPSYALYLAEVAREMGVDPRVDFNFRIMFFSGEPGAGVPSVKRRIEETFDCRCVDTGSTAEMTPWMTNGECEHRTGMHLWQDIVYTEVVDPDTGEVVDYGEEGVPVYTHLERDSQPMIRFFSGDLTKWTDEPCECGRTYPRLPNGVYGRVDDMFIVRGENIYPSAVQEALERTEGYGGEFRVVITREREMDVMTVQAEYSEEVGEKARVDPTILERVRDAMEENIKTLCGVRGVVDLVPYHTFERTEFKARRVADKRDLYEELRRLAEREV
ncbi:MAG: phenylacetate--CoA ligase family protein [Candidatus Geothermarchaeales archaeon]